MGLHIVIGFKGQSSTAEAFPVYVGRDATAALKAMETSDAPRFERFSNVTGIRKNNQRAVLNTAKAEAAAEAAAKAEAEGKGKGKARSKP